MKSKPLRLAAKIAITLFLLGLLIWKVDWREVQQALGQVRLLWVALVLAAMIGNVFLSALKWRTLLGIHGLSLPLGLLSRYYFTAMFLNNFLPTSIGGDAYRIYRTASASRGRSAAVVAVLMERLTGFAALLLLGYLGGIVTYARTGDAVSRLVVILGTAGILVAAAGCLALARPGARERLLRSRLLPSRLRPLTDRMGEYGRHPRKVALVALLSVTFHVSVISYRLLLVHAAGASCSPSSLAVVVAVSSAVALLPISLNGIGLLDGSYVVLLTHYGVPEARALLVMLLIRLLHVPLTLIGGILYASFRGTRAPAADEASARLS